MSQLRSIKSPVIVTPARAISRRRLHVESIGGKHGLSEAPSRTASRSALPRSEASNSTQSLTSWFVSALVTAGHCRTHTPCSWQFRTTRSGRTKHQLSCAQRPRSVHTSQKPCMPAPVTVEDFLEVVHPHVDTPGSSSPSAIDHTLRGSQAPNFGLNFKVSDETRDHLWPPQNYIWPAHGAEKIVLRELQAAVETETETTEAIYALYKALAAPRIPYLSSGMRSDLLRRLAFVERRDNTAMLRYMAVIDDIRACAVPLARWQWNTALSFAGRFISGYEGVDILKALQLWRDMETSSKIESNAATFNILFSAAIRAGKFALAEMFVKEMQSRGLPFDRYHRVSIITSHGLKRDGDGVRASYTALVKAGEIVDTVVLNALMAAFVRCHEPQAAELVYVKMKEMYLKSGIKALPHNSYLSQRQINHHLAKLAELARADANLLPKFQDEAIIAPNVGTYSILIKHFGQDKGDIQKVATFLREMRWYRVPLHGVIFKALFHAFCVHGAARYSDWTAARLRSVWAAYVVAAGASANGLWTGKWLVIWILRAFAAVTSRTEVREIWDQLETLWTPESADARDHVLTVVNELTTKSNDEIVLKPEVKVDSCDRSEMARL